MNLKEGQASNLKRIVDALSRFNGVVSILLFGSYARGDYDEYSDYDLLVIFDDKPHMWRVWDDLFKAAGNLGMNLHVIPETIEEFKKANPVFLEELIKTGKILYAKFPMEVFLKPVKLKPYTLIFYEMSGLNTKDKMKASYLLYRKGGEGLVAKTGGIKLYDGCILIPRNNAENILKALNNLGIKTRKIEIFLNGDSIQNQ